MKIIPLPPSEQLRSNNQLKQQEEERYIPNPVQSGKLYTYQAIIAILEHKCFHERTYQELQEYLHKMRVKLGRLVGGTP